MIVLPRGLGVRRKLRVRFPYAIVFVDGDTFVRVISVTHGLYLLCKPRVCKRDLEGLEHLVSADGEHGVRDREKLGGWRPRSTDRRGFRATYLS